MESPRWFAQVPLPVIRGNPFHPRRRRSVGILDGPIHGFQAVIPKVRSCSRLVYGRLPIFPDGFCRGVGPDFLPSFPYSWIDATGTAPRSGANQEKNHTKSNDRFLHACFLPPLNAGSPIQPVDERVKTYPELTPSAAVEGRATANQA